MTARRAGQPGQIDPQGRSHEAPDCGTYQLVQRTAPSTWLVQWTAPCDADANPALRQSTLRFVSRDTYSRYF